MGLHESIGWKTAEYVVAAKAVINERFHYEVSGNFEIGQNYLEFATADECISQVKYLIENPETVYLMKVKNQEYYQNYLRPSVLIKNTINIVGE